MADSNVYKSKLHNDMILIVIEWLKYFKYDEAAHSLEAKSAIFFDLQYYEQLIFQGEWEKAESYLSNFIPLDLSNSQSLKIYFELRKQKYYETLDRKDTHAALDILLNDLEPFSKVASDIYSELSKLLVMEDIRENKALKTYSKEKARQYVADTTKGLIQSTIPTKLKFPNISQNSGPRLKYLINQSINYQHSFCIKEYGDYYQHHSAPITTLLVDHPMCPPPPTPMDTIADSPKLLNKI